MAKSNKIEAALYQILQNQGFILLQLRYTRPSQGKLFDAIELEDRTLYYFGEALL